MIRHLTKPEDGWAVVIDQPFIDLLKIEPQTPLRIATDGDSITVTPINEMIRRAEFEAALEEVNREFGNTLRRLAEYDVGEVPFAE